MLPQKLTKIYSHKIKNQSDIIYRTHRKRKKLVSKKYSIQSFHPCRCLHFCSNRLGGLRYDPSSSGRKRRRRLLPFVRFGFCPMRFGSVFNGRTQYPLCLVTHQQPNAQHLPGHALCYCFHASSSESCPSDAGLCGGFLLPNVCHLPASLLHNPHLP